jgi:3D (Asp-Asp-Asp) domain-containing protein
MSDRQALLGDGTWPWPAYVEGDDIVVENVRATCFGGSSDPQDNGDTASGISTKANPALAACALPMRYAGRNAKLRAALGGSPIPKMPWQTKVAITYAGITITVPVIDLGPAKRTGNAIDLTIAAARRFNPKATARNFAARVSYRILGGAKFAGASRA